MYDGWMTLAGNEIINMGRTSAYVNAGYVPAGLQVQDCEDCEFLSEMVGDDPYTSPIIDGAPWLDTSNADTYDFAGVLPLEITGLNGSTRSVDTTELSVDGGVANRVRFAARTVAVSALLLGRTGCAVEAGLAWLSTALGGTACSGPKTSPAGSCSGDEMCVFTCCPSELDEAPVPGETEIEHIPTFVGGWKAVSGLWDNVPGKFTPLDIAPGTAVNLITNPSFEVAATGWSITGGTLARSGEAWSSRVGAFSALVTAGSTLVETVTVAPDSSAGLALSLSASGSSVLTNPTVEAVTVSPAPNGTTVTLAASGAKVAGPGGPLTVSPVGTYPVTPGQIVDWTVNLGAKNQAVSGQTSLVFKTSGGATISTFTGVAAEVRAGSYSVVRASVTAPATAATVEVRISLSKVVGEGGGPPAVGAQAYLDGAGLFVGGKQAGRGYFDGDTNGTAYTTYSWDGVPGLSTSRAVTVLTQPYLAAPVQQCAQDSVWRWNVSTLNGPVVVVPAAMDPVTGSLQGYGQAVTVSGDGPVTYLPDPAWEAWIPVLVIDQLPSHPFTVAPTLTHARYKTAAECADDITRSFYEVTTLSGPTVVQKIGLPCGEYLLKVEWTMYVGNPSSYGSQRTLATRLSSKDGTAATVATGVNANLVGVVLNSQTKCPAVPDVSYQVVLPAKIAAIVDPCCPGFLTPPSLPTLADDCWDHPLSFRRSALQIPPMYAPGNEEGTFVLTLTNDSRAKRGLRLRVYPDPVQHGYLGVENCDFCEEFNVTYIPPYGTMTIDGVTKRITTRAGGSTEEVVTSASVRGVNGGPFGFPALQCNMGYVIVLDNPVAYAETCNNDKAGTSQGDVWLDVALRTAAT